MSDRRATVLKTGAVAGMVSLLAAAAVVSPASALAQTPYPPGPSPVPCGALPTLTLAPTTILAGAGAVVSVTAPANSIIDLLAYTRPSTTYRVVRSAEVGADRNATFTITPPANTRVFAQQRGCPAGPSQVLNVRTTISLSAVRNGVRDYTFSGDTLPARPGGLIVSLYRVEADGRQVLTAQTRASATTGEYSIRRVFTGTGRFGFVVRTGQDLQNAPGSSNVRNTLVF